MKRRIRPTLLVLLWVWAVLVFVINRRSFGWSVDFVWMPGELGRAIVLAVAAAILAGAYPAWKMSRTAPAEALREE